MCKGTTGSITVSVKVITGSIAGSARRRMLGQTNNASHNILAPFMNHCRSNRRSLT